MSNPAWNGTGGAYNAKDGARDDIMNSATMSSTQAEAARQRSAEIMEALKNGKPGDADALMGKRSGEEDGKGSSKLGSLKDRMMGRQ
jgi:hypothetical protein